jgi:ATP-binding cassette subfamily F protein uup
MAILLDAQQLTASFGARPLFDGISFTVDEKERIGLIGPNGAGKSTLLRILAELASPDRGTIARRRGLRVALLEQTPRFAAGATVRDTIVEGIGDAHDSAEAHEQERQVLATLALDDAGGALGPDTPVASLSGGWKKRVAIGRALARRPDLLLLDEPTNHLDVEGIEWLEALLARKGAAFATITVTHDRLFLQRVTTRILELDRRNPGGLLSVAGDYATYVRVKEETMHAQERREVVLRNTLRRETEWLRRGAAARTTKQQARIARAGTLGEEVTELARRNQTRTATLDFVAAEARPRRLIEARGIAKGYDGRTIFEGVDLRLGPGVRVGLLGPNGCGKSTLIRVLLGEEAPSAGTVVRADGLQVAYFQQTREALDPARTLADTLCPDGDHVTFRGARVHVRGYLERFLFESEQMQMAVGKLSGGEQSRLLLAQLMLREAQLLVLDEPTNDLDLPTLSVLEDSLTGFEGAVLLVTHDRYFLDQVATTILAFDTRDGGAGGTRGVVPFASLAQWEAWRAETAAAEKAAATAPSTQGADEPSGSSGGRKKLGYIEQREYEAIEAMIAKAEAALAAARAESERPEHASDHAKLVTLLAIVEQCQAEVDRLYARWAALEAKLDAGS